jgi:hypothetical protein
MPFGKAAGRDARASGGFGGGQLDMRMGRRPSTLHVYLIKPSKYDDDGFVIRIALNAYRELRLASGFLMALVTQADDTRLTSQE